MSKKLIGSNKKERGQVICFLAIVTCFLIFSCENPILKNLMAGSKDNNNPITENPISSFVAVTNITGVPETAIIGIPLYLDCTVMPQNATNKTVFWNVKEGTATISWDSFFTNDEGTVTIKAVIPNGIAYGENFIKEFTITVQRPVEFSVSFTADSAPEITGPTIYLSGGADRPTTVTLTVDNPDQYSSIMWYIPGTPIAQSGEELTLNSTNNAYNKAGDYFLTVEVIKNGQPFNRTVMFTVAE